MIFDCKFACGIGSSDWNNILGFLLKVVCWTTFKGKGDIWADGPRVCWDGGIGVKFNGGPGKGVYAGVDVGVGMTLVTAEVVCKAGVGGA